LYRFGHQIQPRSRITGRTAAGPCRTNVTGGMSSHRMDEAFGEDYVLPPDRSYCETCAGVASIMFSWRLLLATGPRYADLIERTLYNIVATSLGEDGRSSYANTLHQRHPDSEVPLNDDGVCMPAGAKATTTADGIQIPGVVRRHQAQPQRRTRRSDNRRHRGADQRGARATLWS
jgi:hypothetical protein